MNRHCQEAFQIDKGEKTALLAVLMNLIIFSIKFIAAHWSGSIALRAESFHSLADLIASLTIFIGLKIAKRKSRTFPYGLYKLENLLSVFVSLAILYTGYEIILEVLQGPDREITHLWLAISSLLVSIFATFLFSRYEKKVAKLIRSPILLADAAHIKIDVLSNLVVLAAILSNMVHVDLDRIAAILVVLIIVKTGLQILIDGARVLLDASVDYDTLSKVEKIILGTPQVVELKSLTGRNSGRFTFIEAMIVLKTHNFDKAHQIVEQIEKKARDEIKGINRVLIQYEPLRKATLVYALPLMDDLASISPHFGEAPHFVLITARTPEKMASHISVLDNPSDKVERGKGIMAAEMLVHSGVDVVVIQTDFTSKGPFYVFADANIEVIQIRERSPEEALKSLGVTLPANLSLVGSSGQTAVALPEGE